MRYWLIEGELYMAPAPNLYHQTISGNLEFILRSYLEQNPLGIVLHAPVDVVFHGESIWQPDIFVVLNANRHILKEQRCEGVPDFIVEILSPNNRELDLLPHAPGMSTVGRDPLMLRNCNPKCIAFGVSIGKGKYLECHEGRQQIFIYTGLKIRI